MEKYKYNVIHENHVYSTGEDYKETLILRNVSLEEAFLIARLCDKVFRNIPFSIDSKGNIYFLSNEYYHYLSIEKDSKNNVIVEIGGGV